MSSDKRPFGKAPSPIVHLTKIILLSALLASPSPGAVQRMGIAKGLYDIAAGSVQNVTAVCFDFTRESPSAGVTFAQVLASADKVSVKVGADSMPLQKAIDE